MRLPNKKPLHHSSSPGNCCRLIKCGDQNYNYTSSESRIASTHFRMIESIVCRFDSRYRGPLSLPLVRETIAKALTFVLARQSVTRVLRGISCSREWACLSIRRSKLGSQDGAPHPHI